MWGMQDILEKKKDVKERMKENYMTHCFRRVDG